MLTHTHLPNSVFELELPPAYAKWLEDSSLYVNTTPAIPAAMAPWGYDAPGSSAGSGGGTFYEPSDDDEGLPGRGAEQPEFPPVMPVLPLRDVVIFNYMIIPLFVGRDKSVQAVDAALNTNRFLFVVAQKDDQNEDPGENELYKVGMICIILRMLKMSDGRLKVLVQGVSRANLLSLDAYGPFLSARVEAMPEEDSGPLSVEQEALLRTAREESEKILTLRGFSVNDVMGVLNSVDDPGRLADLVAANLRMKVSDAQAILECMNPLQRLSLVIEQLTKEAEVASVQAKIQNTAREGMDKAQRDYFLREQLKAIRKELGDTSEGDDDLDDLAKALDKAKLPKDARAEASRQLKRLGSMHGDSSEAAVVRTYLDWLIELPWNKQSRDRLDIPEAKKILDEDHYGLDKVKERILEYLSVRKLNPASKGAILCFVGPPGVGKTSLGRSIARALGRKFQRMSLGGMRDEAEIRGHRRTYVGAMPGRIIQAVKQAGTRNPVIMLDEIDKLGTDFRGDPASALLEVLDPEQNNTFTDHYLNLAFDLSRVMFICTANYLEAVPPPLRDRMEIIRLPGYTMHEKLKIAQRYLMPRQTKENGLKEKEVSISDAVVRKIVDGYTREAGLRNLERELGAVCRKLARRKAEGEAGPYKVTPELLHELLGAPRFLDDEKERQTMPGLAQGLAWTPYGGEVLYVEAAVMKGKGKLTLTGQLGDVMRESAQAAVSYIRSRAAKLGIDPGFAEEEDIHIHVPAGATPKDGPSAGVTLTTALISILAGAPVASDLCMTGEITLRGRVMPVGGIKEKILAAVARGIKRVVIPKQNSKDLEEIPAELLAKIEVFPVSRFEEIMPLAFGKDSLKNGKMKSRDSKEKSGSVKKTDKPERPRSKAKESTGEATANV